MIKEDVISYLQEGKSYADIARIYKISRQRVHEYVNTQQLTRHREEATQQQIQQEELKYLKKWGSKGTIDTLLYQAQRAKWRRKKANAKRLKVPFDLPFGVIHWPDKCPLLDIPLDYFADKITVATPTFDRYDPTKGYVEGNVWVISAKANAIKNNYTREEVPEFFARMDKLFSSLDTPYYILFQESMLE